MFLGETIIDEVLVFTVSTKDPTTKADRDADSDPTYRIYERETGTPILTGTMSKLDDSNTTGFYSESITLSAANGVEVDKNYTILITATVDSVTASKEHSFKCVPTVTVANGGVKVDSFSAGAITAAAIATDAIDADAIAADAIGASEIAAGAVTKVQSGLATSSAQSTTDGKVDAIKAKTDSLTFTVGGKVDANVKNVNDVGLTGDGEGTPIGAT